MKLLKTILYSFAFVLFMPILGNAQQKTKSNDIALINAAKDIMENAKTCALATIDDKGRPRIRTMDPFLPEDDLVVWFGTNSHSRKVKQIQENPKVTLYYEDTDKTGYVMIHGIAKVVDDITEKRKHWKKEWEQFYPNYPDDYLLIKVSPEWMEVVSETRNILGNPKTWKPQKVTF
jgi:general stress protein 26